MKIKAAFKIIFFPINNIISQYLIRNVLMILGAVFLVIGLLIFGNQLVLVVKESLREGIPIVDLFPLITFKMIRDIPLILSLSLFLSIILAINKLYKDSEAIVMNSMGIGDKHFMLFIQPIVISIFLFILLLTTLVVPWSKQQRSLIMERTENASEFSFIKQGEFQTFKDGNIVFYASKVKNGNKVNEQEMESIFIYALINDKPVIALAKQAQKYTNSNTKSVYLRLKNGRRYHGFPSDENKKVLNFDAYDLQIIDGKKQQSISSYNKIEGRSTFDLLGSDKPSEIAEFQWRFSQPFSILILSALGILLGKTSPKGGKNLGVLIAIVIFILYNNALLIAKSGVEDGDFSAAIGLWSPHLLVVVLMYIFYAYQHGKLSRLLTLFKDSFKRVK